MTIVYLYAITRGAAFAFPSSIQVRGLTPLLRLNYNIAPYGVRTADLMIRKQSGEPLNQMLMLINTERHAKEANAENRVQIESE